MGRAYAVHLAQAGFGVIGVDPSQEAQQWMIEHGVVVGTLESVCSAAPIAVVLSLPTASSFDAVVDGLVACAEEQGSAPERPLVVVDTSTLGPDTKRHGFDRLGRVGVALTDCPVSGTGAQARSRDLIVYASGSSDALDQVDDVLATIARRVHRVGEFGRGTTVKLLANLLVGIHNVAAAEMLALAERADVDPSWVLPLVADGAGQSRMLEQRGPSMARGDYGYGASVDLFCKDLEIIQGFARSRGALTPLLDVVAAMYDQAASLGLGAEESAAVHRVYLHAP